MTWATLGLLVLFLGFVATFPSGDGALRLPLRRQHRPSNTLRQHAAENSRVHGSQKKSVATSFQSPFHLNFTDSGPFRDFAQFRDEVFTVDVTLGTPARQFNVTLDYAWGYAFFFNDGHPEFKQGHICVIPGIAPWRRNYDPANSSSSVQVQALSAGFALGEPYVPVGCNTDFSETAVSVTDILQIGPISTSIPFVFITNAWGSLNFEWPSDAVLGLLHDHDGGGLAQYAVYSILSKLPQSTVIIYYDRKETASAQLNGQITFGGPDTQNCGDKWTFVQADPWRGWWFNMTTFAYGNKLRSDKLVIAGLSSTTALITGPPDVVDYIVVYTGAEYDFLSDSFVLPCPKHGQFPEMVFEFDGAEYRVPDIDYIRQLPHNRKGYCTLMVTGGDYGTDMWTLGTSFSRPYCTLFDYPNYRVGFAQVSH